MGFEKGGEDIIFAFKKRVEEIVLAFKKGERYRFGKGREQALVKQGNAEAAHRVRSLRAGHGTAIRCVAPA